MPKSSQASKPDTSNPKARATEHSPESDVIQVIYDETHRAKWYSDPKVDSVCNMPNLLGYLRHYGPDTDGSFAICLAGGNCTLVRKSFYDSIPEKHRPPLDDSVAGQEVDFIVFERTTKALGSTIMPIVLTNDSTGRRFCIKLYALVVEDLLPGMFIGRDDATFLETEQWGARTTRYTMDFGNGFKPTVVYKHSGF